MASSSELGCVYASLILADDNVEVTDEKIATLLKAAKVDFEPFWPGLFAKSLAGKDVMDLVSNVGSAAAGPAPAGGAAAAGGAAPAAEEKKEEAPAEESEDEDMDGFSLFD